MQREKILEAKRLAQEFIRTVDQMEMVEGKMRDKKASLLYCLVFPSQKEHVYKASMDLTMALADIRRP